MVNVVVGYDGSEPALWALDWAAKVATEDGELHLVQMLTPTVTFPEAPMSPEEILDQQQAAMHAALLRVGYERSGGAGVTARITRWLAVDSMLEEAERTGSELIAVGRTGLGRLGQMILGSTSQALIRHSSLPVLVAGGPAPEERPTQVLVAVDGSIHAIRALRLAYRWFPDALLTALIAIPKGAPHAGAEATLRDSIRTAGGDFERAKLVVAEAPAAAAILDAVRRGQQVVFMGHRGLTPLQELVMGSVSAAVVRQAPCAVIVVK